MKRLPIKILILAVLISAITFSCKNEEKAGDKIEVTSEKPSSEEMKNSMSENADIQYNPAHGEEGHRCELPVGAPLQQANASATPEMTTSPVRMKSAAPKINPPHGEPGHDCSIAVGAELKQ
ncbi:hypothetical protein [Christiangramia sp.]|uniref:hypothetical protein n=1 Tax=Christiangramia sp. TaxID=1931228 RepID=UPI002623B3F7|nr:hypothetical protein [Christiangramia sp.]